VLGQPRVECGEPQRAKRSPGKAGDGSMAVSGKANMPLVIIRTATSLTARVPDRAYQIAKMSSEVGCPDTEVRHLQLGGHCVGACDSAFLPTVLLSDHRDHRAHGIASLLICDLCAICGWYLIFSPILLPANGLSSKVLRLVVGDSSAIGGRVSNANRPPKSRGEAGCVACATKS
jgi:hypothetical protein